LYAVSGSNKELADGSVIFFDENYTDAIDGYDSRKMSNFGENFSMKKSGAELVVERRTLPTKNDTVQFAMYYMKKMSYQLKISANKLQQTGMLAFLEDKYLKSFTPLNLDDTTNYTFSVDANAGSSASDRFRIVMKPAVVLPVTITAVKAYEQPGKIAVEWQVSNQINIREYQVEKSLNGKDFSFAGKVAAAVLNSAAISYNWLDATPVQGANYYRIKSVGTDGSAKYTQIAKVTIGKLAPAFAVSPNPVTGSIMNLQLVNQPKGNYHIRLINNGGQLVFKQAVIHNGGSAAQSISLPSELSKGYYQLEIITPGAGRTIQSLIINN